MKFHTQTNVQSFSTRPLQDFLDWVQTLIPFDKFKIFQSLFRFPLKTNEITAICFDKLSRIFEGGNTAFNYQFMSADARDDWEYYRKDVLNEPKVWMTDGWEHFKTDFNSILVVDMPKESNGQAEPYFYWLPIENVIDYETDCKGELLYLIFKQEDKIAVIDNESYQLYESKNENIDKLIHSTSHELGYCPCKFFWNEPLSLKEQDIKASPISRELEALDWYLFFHISKRHLDLYGAYPIYSGFEQACDYSNSENGDYCCGGFLKNKDGNYLFDASGLVKCPRCGDKRIAGVGSFVEVPIPLEGQADLRNPVQMLTADVDCLKYNVSELTRLKEEVINSVVGVNSETLSKQSYNEKQIDATFENQNTILNRIKLGFEEAQQFVDDTICRLRYGANYLSSSINYGTQFYTLTTAELRERYKTAKDAGASEAELDALQATIIETEYRTNPNELERMRTLAEIEPYRHLSIEEVGVYFEKGLITEQEVKLKMRFSDLIRRFERENGNIVEFGVQMPFYKKIETIKQTLLDYVSTI